MDKRNAVIAGQEAVCNGKTTFVGPTTDDLTGPKYRQEDNAHFSTAGLKVHGQRWAQSLIEIFQHSHPNWVPKK